MPPRCTACTHRKARRTCACCHRPTCAACADEIGGMTHCPACASDAREFINTTPLEVSRVPAQMPGDGQVRLPHAR